MTRLGLYLLSISLLAGCSVNLKREDNGRKPINVEVAFKNGSNELNTAEGYYRRETQPSHFAQTKFSFTPEQQILILNKAIVTQFFALPDTLTKKLANSPARFLDIRVDSGTTSHPLGKRVTWFGDMFAPMVGSTQLPVLMLYVDSIVTSTPEVQQLPPPKTN